MKIAISGSHGFIGEHLIKAFEKRGDTIFRISQELLYQPQELRGFFNEIKPEIIAHLAAYGNMSNHDDIAMTVLSNIIGTMNMLDASREVEYKKFIYFSSSSVLLDRETFYSASKAGAERLCKAYAMQYNKPILTVRPFSIYGPNEADFRFIPTVIRSLIKKEPLQLAPNAYHDWVYIGDFIKKLLSLTDNSAKGKVNMGTGKSYSNLEVATEIAKIAGKPLKYEEMELRDFDTKKWVSPQATVDSDLKKGLRKTYEWYEQRYGHTQ